MSPLLPVVLLWFASYKSLSSCIVQSNFNVVDDL